MGNVAANYSSVVKMAVKLLGLFVVAALAAALTQGQTVTQITLPDHTHQPFLTNPLIGKTISIAKSFLDTLELCRVTFPNGFTYEAYPNSNLPPGPITFLSAVQPFTSCGIGFLNVPVSVSGTYELQSTVRHSADNSQSLTRQRHHLTFVEIDPWKADAPNAAVPQE